MASQKLIVMVAFIMLLTFVEQTVTYSKCPSFEPSDPSSVWRMGNKEGKGGGGGGERGWGEGISPILLSIL